MERVSTNPRSASLTDHGLPLRGRTGCALAPKKREAPSQLPFSIPGLLPRFICDFVLSVKIRYWRFDLKLAHRWAIARSVQPGGSGGTDVSKVVFVQLTDTDGATSIGEAAPSSRYGENVDSVLAFLERADPNRLSFGDVPGAMDYLMSLAPKNLAATGAINIALVDGAAQKAGQPVYHH